MAVGRQFHDALPNEGEKTDTVPALHEIIHEELYSGGGNAVDDLEASELSYPVTRAEIMKEQCVDDLW